ncbi:MAG: hypothetical protein HWN66_03055 [Candidatus Helarchaeota archaeon]|nr:hypothetical protein [Candidatus Helarchaeota archaeon]
MSSKENKITPRYGIEVPIEVIKKGKLSNFLVTKKLFTGFSIKNPSLGPYLDRLRNKIGITRAQFCEIFGKAANRYNIIVNGMEGINLEMFLDVPKHPIVQKELTAIQLNNLKVKFENFLTAQNTIIVWSKIRLKFNLNNLEKIKLNNQIYVILPITNWEVKKTRDAVKEYIIEYYKKNIRAPDTVKIRKKFSGFIESERLSGRTYNDFLRECKIPPIREKIYNWADPKDRKIVEDWVIESYNEFGQPPTGEEAREKFSGFVGYLSRHGTTWNDYLRSHGYPLHLEMKYDYSDPQTQKEIIKWIEDYVDFYGRSPTSDELKEVFGGFINYLLRQGMTWNDFLKKYGFPINLEINYDWSDPKNIAKVETWLKNYFDKYEESPSAPEVDNVWGGFRVHIGKLGKTLNDFLQSRGYPIYDKEKNQKEGDLFDNLGKFSLNLINKNCLINYRVHHPTLESTESYLIPDGIVHNLAEKPIKLKGKSIFLKRGQKLDEIIEFKRSYGGIKPKDWAKYPKIAKKIKFYLLKGGVNIPPVEIHGCKISFHSKKELITELKMRANPSNRSKINKTIQKIFSLDKGITDLDDEQLSLDAF